MKNRRTKIIIIALGFLLLIFLALKIFLPPPIPLISSTSPFDRQNQVSQNQKIIIIFDQKILPSDWSIISSPQFEFSLTATDKQLEITPKELLKPQTQYNLEIKSQKFKQFHYSFTFTTLSPPIVPLSTEEGRGDPNFPQLLQQKISQYYPLLNDIPFKSTFWSIDYSGALTLKVILKKDSPEIRQEVLDWIKAKGVDPSSHKTEW